MNNLRHSDKIILLFHDDWEIYGDGTGDPVKLMFDPAKKLLDICDQYGAKYTFYPEIGQQLHMLNAPTEKWRKYAKIWEEILKDAVSRGHDVQLHFHPQWIGASLKNDNWTLDYTRWNTGSVCYEELNEWIGRGADYLRGLFKTVRSDYDVLSYRAGGWLCQPSTNLYKALKNNGIICDVSIMKGRYQKYEDCSYVDFRNTFSIYEPWEVLPDDFTREQKGSGLWELPVFTEVSALPHPVYLLKKVFRPFYYYSIFKKKKSQKSVGSYSPRVVERTNLKEYYGNFGLMHFKHLYSILGNVKREMKRNDNISHLIYLTHSKGSIDFKNFQNFLEIVITDNKVGFSTTRSYIYNYLKG